MIATIVRRDLWQSRFALLLQAASLAIAIASMAASYQMKSLITASPIPGSACADRVVGVIGEDENHRIVGAWTPRQTATLMAAIPTTPSSPVMSGSLEANSDGGEKTLPAAFVGEHYFDVLCVSRYDRLDRPLTGDFTQGAVLNRATAAHLVKPASLQSQALVAQVTALTPEFAGTGGAENATLAWLPIRQAASAGVGVGDFPVVSLLVRTASDSESARVFTALQKAVDSHRDLFGATRSVRPQLNLGMDGPQAQTIRDAAVLLQLFAVALLVMVVANVIIYHAGRLVAARGLASILLAMGTPPWVLGLYAAAEPFVVSTIAIMAGLWLAIPLEQATMAISVGDAPAGPWTWRPMVSACAVALMVGALAAWVRHRAFARERPPAKGRAQRHILQWLPWLLALQVALAAVTMTIAAQAAIGLFLSTPPSPRVVLKNLTVASLSPSDRSPDQHSLQLRWKSAWLRLGPAGYQAALATGFSPFIGTPPEIGALGSSLRPVPVFINRVTADFFSVLGLPLPSASRAFLASRSETVTSSSDPLDASVVVLNATAMASLSRMHSDRLAETLLRKTDNFAFAMTDQGSTARVVGVLGDGFAGVLGAQAKMDVMTMGHNQAVVPTVYLPLNDLLQRQWLRVFIRHPPGVSDAAAAAAILPAVQSLIPTATIANVTSGEQAFAKPLRREHAVTVVFGMLAIASLLIGALGLVSVMSLLEGALRTHMAVCRAVGATYRQAFAIMANRTLPPVLTGLVLAIVPCRLLLAELTAQLESTAIAGWRGPAAATGVLLAIVGGVLLASFFRVRAADPMSWLLADT